MFIFDERNCFVKAKQFNNTLCDHPVAHLFYSSGLGALRVPTKVISYSETCLEFGSIPLLNSCSILHQACRSNRCLLDDQGKTIGEEV